MFELLVKMHTSKQFHAQIAPGYIAFIPVDQSKHKGGHKGGQAHHNLELGKARRAHKSNQYLCNPVMLQVDHPGHCHLHATKHCYHFQNLVIKGGGCKCLVRYKGERIQLTHSSVKEVSFTS